MDEADGFDEGVVHDFRRKGRPLTLSFARTRKSAGKTGQRIRPRLDSRFCTHDNAQLRRPGASSTAQAPQAWATSAIIETKAPRAANSTKSRTASIRMRDIERSQVPDKFLICSNYVLVNAHASAGAVRTRTPNFEIRTLDLLLRFSASHSYRRKRGRVGVLPNPDPKYHNSEPPEPWPASCPPSDATAPIDGVLLRLVTSATPTADDFSVGSSEQRKKPQNCDLCRWLACSVWLAATPRNRLSALTRLPKLRDRKYIAFLKVGPDAGRQKPHDTDPNHISLWMYATFDPKLNIQKTEPL